jgi:hypothetical protein
MRPDYPVKYFKDQRGNYSFLVQSLGTHDT